MNSASIKLAVVGATGLVGRTTLQILDEWKVPLASLRLFASDDSAGRDVEWRGQRLKLEKLSEAPREMDAAIFCTSRAISRQWVPVFRKAGIAVIDHSSEFRMNSDVPLVIPEVNGAAMAAHCGLIANPNCSASVIVIPLAVIDRVAELRMVIADTYQSVSGSGQDAVSELDEQLRNDAAEPHVYPRLIAHNVFPQIGAFDERGVAYEEQKVVEELQKILDKPTLRVLTTTVRVPVRVGHSAALTVQCERSVTVAEIEAAFAEMPGMIYEKDTYRTPREIAGKQEVFVSRLRQARDDPHWLQFWVTGDNLRKGAASNAIQILLELYKN
jgi:aspartate-semialdehyde dehydrogenase